MSITLLRDTRTVSCNFLGVSSMFTCLRFSIDTSIVRERGVRTRSPYICNGLSKYVTRLSVDWKQVCQTVHMSKEQTFIRFQKSISRKYMQLLETLLSFLYIDSYILRKSLANQYSKLSLKLTVCIHLKSFFILPHYAVSWTLGVISDRLKL